MTRLSATLRTYVGLTVLAVVAAIVVAGHEGAQADSTYRVDAIFDTAKGILPKQVVKIAGAKVGTIKDVTLTDDNKARIQMEVEHQFAPFRSDATCQIQPEGLISENFVQCEPGTPDGRPLNGEDGHAPTVPVKNTSVPVSLTDLFNIWKVPVRDRFNVVLSTLGAGAAGRGSDINALIRRASPALTLLQKVSGIADRQRDQIKGLVTSTDRVIGELAKRKRAAADFIDAADQVSQRTARKQQQLRATVRGLPGLLDATQPALERLDELSASGSPLLDQLRGAAPQAQRLVTGLAPFATASRGALRDLGTTADQGRTTIRHAKPVVKLLRTFSGEAIPAGLAVDQLFGDLRQRGFVENLLKVVYGIGSTAARYDDVSHVGPARISLSTCASFAVTTNADCSARFSGATGTTQPAQQRTTPQRKQDSSSAAPAPQRQESTQPQAQQPQTQQRRPDDVIPQVDVPKLLDNVDDTLHKLLPRPPAPQTQSQSGQGSDQAQKGLLDFLFK